jgi:hypothetical protein
MHSDTSDAARSGASGPVEARQTVVGDRLPGDGRTHPLPVAGTNARIRIECAETDEHVVRTVGLAVDVPTTVNAVPLRLTTRRLPGTQPIGSLDDIEGINSEAGVSGRRSAGTTLTIVTVAVTSRVKRSTYRKAHRATGTPSGQRAVQ